MSRRDAETQSDENAEPSAPPRLCGSLGLKLGYLLNFGEAVPKDGITRWVNRLEEDVPQGRGDAE